MRRRGRSGVEVIGRSPNARPGHWVLRPEDWPLFGSPLRPAAADLACFAEEITAWRSHGGGEAPRALLLGVTPEVPRLAWPPGTRVWAVDRSAGMIHGVWPADAPFAAGAVRADWRALPFRDGSADVVIGDGCFTLFRWPEGYRSLLGGLARVLRTGGRLIMRFYLRPATPEPLDRVVADLAAGRIETFHLFKWRLLHALHGDNPEGVRLGDAWKAWQALGLDAGRLARERGWPPAVVSTIDVYRDADLRYSFPTLAELRHVFEPPFRELACHLHDYPLGECCPIVALAREPG
jgi:SAM-dependent methyltransferase